jgi:protein TonB
MIPKKNERAKLENKGFMFFQTGLIITFAVILAAFEWTSSPANMKSFEISDLTNIEEEFSQITRPKELKPPPPKPMPKEVLNIISDTEEIRDEYLGEDIEPDPYQEINIVPFIEDPEQPDDTPFIIIEDMPTFRGEDLLGFRNWVIRNLRYPEIAAENGISGKVTIQFVVGFGGDVEDVTVIRGADPALDKEAIRVVSSSPKWNPGKQRGNPARVIFTFTISFVLQ